MDQTNHITVNERIPSQSFNRYVDQRVQEWMTDHSIEVESGGEKAEYEVAFFDEEALGEVSCLVVLRDGEHLWRAWESGDNPKRALSLCLNHLREDLERHQSLETDSSQFSSEIH